MRRGEVARTANGEPAAQSCRKRRLTYGLGDVSLGHLLGRFEKAMQQHVALGEAKDVSAYRAVTQMASDFPEALAKRTTGRHAHGPTELDRLNIVTNRASVLVFDIQEPFPNRFTALEVS
jgi:hypothetical protein